MITWEECELLIKGTQQEFDTIMEGKSAVSDSDISNLREGDLILRTVDSNVFYHAGIYCGNEEVIEFTALSEAKWFGKLRRLLLPQQSASVCKVDVKTPLNGSPYRVLRMRSGISEDFQDRVKMGMRYNEEYNLLTNNSLHFALRLLGLTAEPLPERNSSCNSENTSAFWFWKTKNDDDDVKKASTTN